MHSLALKRLSWCVKWPKYLYRIVKTCERAAKQHLRPLREKQLYKLGKNEHLVLEDSIIITWLLSTMVSPI